MKKKATIAFLAASLAALSAFSFGAEKAFAEEEKEIISSDFEDGNINPWFAFGGGALEIDETVSHSGGKSLKMTERIADYQGPALNCSDFFLPNEAYEMSGWVYNGGEKAATIAWSIKYTDEAGEAKYSRIDAKEVEGGDWAEISTTIIIPDYAVSYQIYFEASDLDMTFNVDDIKISGKSKSNDSEGYVEYEDEISFDFESDTESWIGRGDVNILHNDEFGNTGSHSLYVTNRTATWNGASYFSKNSIEKGKVYYYSAYVMYNGYNYEDSHVFRLETQYVYNGKDSYNLIAEKEVKKGKWTKIEGYYTIPEDANNISVYLQTANLEGDSEASEDDLMSFYIDTVRITKGEIMEKEKTKQTAAKISIIVAIAALLILGVFVLVKSVKKNKRAIKLASIDAMTGVLNRNSYEKKFEELQSNTEQCKELFYALCDVNFLKYINDNFGHEKGDEAISRCAKMLSDCTGNDCKVFRTGGDEFICISQSPIEEKIKEAIKTESKVDKGYPFAVACGFAVYDEKICPEIKSIIAECDKKMYADKQRIKAENKEFSRK